MAQNNPIFSFKMMTFIGLVILAGIAGFVIGGAFKAWMYMGYVIGLGILYWVLLMSIRRNRARIEQDKNKKPAVKKKKSKR